MFTASIGSEQGPVEASVVGRSEQIDVCILTIRTKDRFGEFNLFRSGPLALEQILDLGYEIVNACRKLMPQVQEHAPANEATEADVTHDFRPGAQAMSSAEYREIVERL